MKAVKEFFDTHPEADEVYEALGVLFTEENDAETFCGGTTEKPVTHKREFFSHVVTNEDLQHNPELQEHDINPGDKIEIPVNTGLGDEEIKEVFEKENNLVADLPIIHNDATTYGKSAGEVEAAHKEAAEQKAKEPKKESAKVTPQNAAKAGKVKDAGKPSGKNK